MTVKKLIGSILDLMYPSFRKFLPLHVYRYLSVGAICFMINLATFSLSLEYYHMHDIGNSLFPEYWLALLTSQIFSITSGFYLFLNFVFITSSLKTSHQFLRFLVTNLFALLFSMLNLKIMIDYFNWDTNIAYLISVVIVQTANYFVQLNFSFKR